MLRVELCGGFGEKGRTCVAVSDGESLVMLDAGIMVGAEEADYHPRLPWPAERIAALFISHAHEDHIGALPWLCAQGFRGPVYMTAETRADMAETLAQYARPDHLARFRPEALDLREIRVHDSVDIGGLRIGSGASGHTAGGLWFRIAGGGVSLIYSADVVPQSPVFPMTPQEQCDLLILDCSYGTDTSSGQDRCRAIADWIAAHPGGSVLPTPLSGRSIELLAAVGARLAIAADMRLPIARQIESIGRRDLAERLNSAVDWTPGDRLPACPLLVHDGMGQAGPSAAALRQALAEGRPILLSGHLPAGSPAAALHADGRADWLRMPTHPTLTENRAIWERAGRPPALGHSCASETLHAIARTLPGLDPEARTGGSLTVREARDLARSHRQ